MKGLKVLLFGMCMALCACSSQTSTVQTSDKGTRWQWENGTIVVETPERPAGQKSVIGLALPKMEAVRVGFVGLGMRDPERWSVLPISPARKLWRFAIMNKSVRSNVRNISNRHPCLRLLYIPAKRGMRNCASAMI